MQPLRRHKNNLRTQGWPCAREPGAHHCLQLVALLFRQHNLRGNSHVQISIACNTRSSGQGYLSLSRMKRYTSPPPHGHDWNESFYVTKDHVQFTCGGQTMMCLADTFVHVPDGRPCHASSYGSGDEMLAVRSVGNKAVQVFLALDRETSHGSSGRQMFQKWFEWPVSTASSLISDTARESIPCCRPGKKRARCRPGAYSCNCGSRSGSRRLCPGCAGPRPRRTFRPSWRWCGK
ncbi:hypothetical protein D3C84_593330 [compost metagenome]